MKKQKAPESLLFDGETASAVVLFAAAVDALHGLGGFSGDSEKGVRLAVNFLRSGVLRACGLIRPALVDAFKVLPFLHSTGCHRCNLFGTIKKGAIYKVIDNFVLFHRSFLKGRKGDDESFWATSYEKPVINNWRGYSFERLCICHVRQIREALGIAGIRSDVYSWRAKSDAELGEDAQIDMLIERADRTITICEMRYAGENEYGFSKETKEKLHRGGRLFREATGVKKAIGYALVTTVALKRNEYSGAVQSVVTLDDLFRE